MSARTPVRPARPTRRMAAALASAALILALTACGGDDDDATPTATTAPTAPPAATTTTAAAAPTATTAPVADAAYPVTIESCDTEYTFDAAPQAVLLGWANSLATLTALGVEDCVIGYVSGGLSKLPEGAPDIPEVSPDFAPSREAVIAAEADLFLLNDLTAISGDGGSASVADLASAGTNVFVLGDYCGYDVPAADSVDAVYQDIRDLGAIFGVPERAEELVSELQERVTTAAASVTPQETAIVQVYDGTLYALSGSNYNMILDALGLENTFADLDANWAEITAEEVLTLEPDAVLVVYDDLLTDPADAIAEINEVLANTPAVSNGTVIALPNSDVSAGGTTLIDLIDLVASELGS